GIPFVTVLRGDGKQNRIVMKFHQLPNSPAETPEAAVQMMTVLLVEAELVLMPVKREAAVGDAVCVTPGDRAEIGRMLQVILKPLQTEHDRTTRDAEVPHHSTIVQDLRFEIACRNRKLLDRRSVVQCPESPDRHRNSPEAVIRTLRF